MSDRIDHAAEAARLLELAAQDVSANFPVMTGEYKHDIIAAAHVHAMLAGLEVQREAVDAMSLANGSYRAVDAEAVDHD